MDWQPIDTAPRDGTDLIGYFPHFGKVWPFYFDETTGEAMRFDDVFVGDPSHWTRFPNPPAA